MKKILVFLTMSIMLSVIISCDSSEELLPQDEQESFELRNDPDDPYGTRLVYDGDDKYWLYNMYDVDVLNNEVEEPTDTTDLGIDPADFFWDGRWKYTTDNVKICSKGLTPAECETVVCTDTGLEEDWYICGFRQID